LSWTRWISYANYLTVG